jgi:hypothetical protein
VARLHEYQGKAILAANGFKIPCGRIVGAEAEEDFAGVVHVNVVVPPPRGIWRASSGPCPEAVHDFVGLHRVGLADAHEYEVVEDALGRQRDVHDLGEVHLEDGQQEFHGRAADVEVFPRRDADDGGIKRS